LISSKIRDRGDFLTAAPRTQLRTLFRHEGAGVLVGQCGPCAGPLSGRHGGKVGLAGWAGPVAQRGFSPQDLGNFEILFYFQNLYSLQIHLNSKQIQTSNSSYSQKYNTKALNNQNKNMQWHECNKRDYVNK
jgi:hypothetical protein